MPPPACDALGDRLQCMAFNKSQLGVKALGTNSKCTLSWDYLVKYCIYYNTATMFIGRLQLNTFYAASQKETELLSSVSLLFIIQSVKTLLSGAFDALLLFKCTWKNNTQHSLSLDRNLELELSKHTRACTHTDTHIPSFTFPLLLVA